MIFSTVKELDFTPKRLKGTDVVFRIHVMTAEEAEATFSLDAKDRTDNKIFSKYVVEITGVDDDAGAPIRTAQDFMRLPGVLRYVQDVAMEIVSRAYLRESEKNA